MKEDSILKIVTIYKDHLRQYGLTDEIYKWELLAEFRGKPDLNAGDFYEELKSVKFANLIYEAGVRVSHHLAQDRKEAYKNCFKQLFDESIPLLERIKYFNEETLKIYRELIPDKRLGHHHDERTMAIFLTYHDPDKYTLYKDSFYQSYCKLIGVEPKRKNEKYVHYLELINDFIEKYIKTDEELVELFKKSLPENVFQDKNFKILAQDILYRTLEKQLGAERSYWRVGTKIEEQNVWEDMQTQKMVCIGWNEIGDLKEKDIKSKKDIMELLKSKGYYIKHKNQLSRKAGEILDFYEMIKEGDVIVAQDGQSILALGIVKDEYQFEEKDIGAHQLSVDWKVLNPDLRNSKGTQTTVFKLTDYNLNKEIDQLLETLPPVSSNLQLMKNTPLNQILFGPPGTGKTYHTINKALAIVGVDIAGLTRSQAKEAFDKKLKEGQIVFTTFHQSMSYEEFIEGIKPTEPEKDGDEVIYRVEPGLFKKLSIEASFDIAKFRKSKETAEALAFSNLYDLFIEEVQEKLINEEEIELETKSGGTVLIDSISQQGNIIVKHHNGIRTYTVSKPRLTKLQAAIGSLDSVSNINNEFREVIGGSNSSAYWSVLNAIKETGKSVNGKVEEKSYTYNDKVEVVKKMTKKDFDTTQGKNYVLIIDEINRGNVSQIFGELITLIEEDKRLGKDEALEVMLPYSKEKFGVPSNLYIIGTMNTADRSVEALDTALRRRFSFTEMPPDPELLESSELNLKDILKTINRRIEKLLDRDHLIGHSYFIRVNGWKDLEESFYRNIIPLLQEYFFGDYAKIGAVLGSGFVYTENETDQVNFATGYENEDFAEKAIYQIIDYRPDQLGRKYIEHGMTFQKAIRLLMNQALEE